MKRFLMTLVSMSILVLNTNADLLKIEVGAGAWMQTPSGDIIYTDHGGTGRDKSKENEETKSYAWLLFKHPIPIIPNVRLEYAGIKSEGFASGKFKKWEVPIGQVTNTTIEVTQYDIIPYYNLLDNTFWMTLDLGIDLKIMDISYDASPTTGFEGYTYSDSLILPLLYVRSRIEIPSTDIGIEADIKYISYDSNTLYDGRIKVDYTLSFIPVIQPAVELGYRVQKLKTDDSQDAQIDMEFAGIYTGIMLRF